MIRDFGILSGVVSFLSIILYTLLFVLRDLYSASKNMKVKKYINKLLPILTKYNSKFILVAFIFSLFHILIPYNTGVTFNFGYLTVFMILLIIKFTFIPSKKIDYCYPFNLISYLLCINLIFHLILN